MGLLRGIGTVVVVGALASSGYAAYELYDAQQVRLELRELQAEVDQLRDRQSGLRAGSVSTADLGSVTDLVRRLDEELQAVRGELGQLEATAVELDALRARLDGLADTADRLASCLERGLLVDEATGRARCD